MLVSRTVYIFRDHFAVVIGSSLKGNIVTENQDFGHWKRLRSFRDFGGRFFFSSFLKKGRSNQTRSHQGPFLSNFEFLFVSWNGHVLCFWLMGCEVSSAKLDKSYHRF